MPRDPRLLRPQGLNASDHALYLDLIRRLHNFEEVVRHHFVYGAANRRHGLVTDLQTHLMTFYRAEFARDTSKGERIRVRIKAFHEDEHNRSGIEPIDCGSLCPDAKEGCKEC